MKKMIITMVMCFSFSSIILSPITTTYATETSIDSYSITRESNKQWIGFEQEFNNLRASQLCQSGTLDLTRDQLLYLINKYDNADSTVCINGRASFSEVFFSGGYNAFASNKTAMVSLRDNLGASATLLQVNGTLGGALAGGPAGALIGLVGATILASRFRDGNNDRKKWISVDSAKGGIRITLTDEFPIANLKTTTQSPIKKL
ncbi:hypothetical protein [Enterococcus sp. DIV1054d]|uniref:hypothetical protein n=1 Tax=Enterococcus sp. DIV1054d TaxID=2774789 RepID=UPI003D2FB153